MFLIVSNEEEGETYTIACQNHRAVADRFKSYKNEVHFKYGINKVSWSKSKDKRTAYARIFRGRTTFILTVTLIDVKNSNITLMRYL